MVIGILLILDTYCELEESPTTKWYSLDPNKFVHLIYKVVLIFPFLPALNVFFDPMSPQYWPSQFIPKNIYTSFPGKLVFAIIEWYMTASGVYSACFFVMVMVVHIHVLNSWLNFFR